MKLGIIGAMQSEVEYLWNAMDGAQVRRISGMEFHEGELAGLPAVVVRSGEGKVNAAMCTQTLILEFNVSHVLNTGVAGSLDASINIGDLVVSTIAVQHDFDETPRGYALGEVPDIGTITFLADETLRATVHKAAHAVDPGIGVHDGPVASGDQFVSSEEAKKRIVEQFGARCCEMEGAAIGQVCYLNSVPFVVVRAISDKADGSAHVSFDDFAAQAASAGARIVEQLAAELAE